MRGHRKRRNEVKLQMKKMVKRMEEAVAMLAMCSVKEW